MVMTEPQNPRALSAEELAALALTFAPRCRIEVEPEPKEALERAWAQRPMICAAGSIFLVGDLLSSLGPSARSL